MPVSETQPPHLHNTLVLTVGLSRPGCPGKRSRQTIMMHTNRPRTAAGCTPCVTHSPFLVQTLVPVAWGIAVIGTGSFTCTCNACFGRLRRLFGGTVGGTNTWHNTPNTGVKRGPVFAVNVLNVVRSPCVALGVGCGVVDMAGDGHAQCVA